jgi:threonine dehydratase
VRTPLRRSEWLSAASGGEVYLKLESVQPTGSFKIRGAVNAVLALVEQGVTSGTPLVTASAGNHGRALAYAARLAGLPLTVYVPENAPQTKLDAIRLSGADLKACRDYDEAEARAKQHGAGGSAIFVSPYSHPDVIAGAGTIALEILDERPDIDTIVAPVGGGGLASGIAIAADALPTRTAVIGVEVDASTPFTQSLAAGRIVTIEVEPTLADGLSGNLDPDTITFDFVRRLVSRIVVVTERQLQAGVRGLLSEERLVAEGAGAAAAAAVVHNVADLRSRRIAVILSGSNIDLEKLKTLI